MEIIEGPLNRLGVIQNESDVDTDIMLMIMCCTMLHCTELYCVVLCCAVVLTLRWRAGRTRRGVLCPCTGHPPHALGALSGTPCDSAR